MLAVTVASSLLISMLAAEAIPESAFRQPRFEVKTTTAVVYGRADVNKPKPGKKDLLLDLYEPAGEGVPAKLPAMVVIHGGGFKGGSRGARNMAGLCRELASRGFVCISIDYRMQGDDPPVEGRTLMERSIRAAVIDAATATKWLIDNAEQHRVDTTRIAVGGGSAGAITSLMLAYRKGVRPERLPIAAVVDLWGSMYRSVDDIQEGDPPVIIIHGTNDRTVPFAGAEAIVDRTRQVGVTCELCAIEGGGHGVNLNDEFEGTRLMQRIVNFLDVQLKLAELDGGK
jgi:acetyl esterase/lipase